MSDPQESQMDSGTRRQWSEAFYRQAKGDWEIYEALGRGRYHACFRLHFLQMASEKLAKAYRFRDPEVKEKALLTKHVGLETWICVYFSVRWVDKFRSDQQRDSVKADIRRTAREVERLAPAVDKENTPSNVEYPWDGSGRVVAPVDHSFAEVLGRLQDPRDGFLKLIRDAFQNYSPNALPPDP